MSTVIEIKGLDQLVKKIDKIEKLDGFKAALFLGAKRVEKRMKKYPPARTGSSYVRTKALGKKWTTRKRDNGLTVVVGNNIRYAPFVQSHKDQAWMHKGHWHTDKQVLDEEKDNVMKLIKKEMTKILEHD